MKILLVIWYFLVSAYSRCSFQVMLDNKPVKVDREPFLVEGMTQCIEYNGQMGCCDAETKCNKASLLFNLTESLVLWEEAVIFAP